MADRRSGTAELHGAEGLAHGMALGDGVLMFCGTLGAIGGVRGSAGFSGRLEDPATGRFLSLEYAVEALPVTM